MDYQEQLKSTEWRIKRKHILERDNYSCQNCGIKQTKFLKLSPKFGIASFEEMKNRGYTMKIHRQRENIVKYRDRNGIYSSAKFISDDKTIVLENLSFALQWNEEEKVNAICFTEIISEDDKFADLNIHHKYYIRDKKAWEYEDKSLITLCEKCHQLEHQNNNIPVKDVNLNFLYNSEICKKCNGSGFLSEFSYYENGVCFECYGYGSYLKNNKYTEKQH